MIYGNFDDNLKEPSMRYTGVAEAMLESAQSDLNMFKAMLALDAYEIKLNEAAEGETDKESLKQKMQKAGQAASGAVANIKEKIAAGLEKLADFMYQAYGAIAMKVRQLLSKDVELAAKNLKNVKRENLSGVKLKWLKINKDPFNFNYNFEANLEKWDSHKSTILEKDFFFAKNGDGKNVKEEVDAASKLNDINTFFNGAYKKAALFAKRGAEIKNKLRKKAAEYRRGIKAAGSKEDAAEASKQYKAFAEFRKTCTKEVAAVQNAMATVLKMYRAALYIVLKKGTKEAKDTNTEEAKNESAMLAFIVQEACYEVDDVMQGIITGGSISEFVMPAPKTSIQEHAELMEAMTAPLF